jgi:hypothetical protein
MGRDETHVGTREGRRQVSLRLQNLILGHYLMLPGSCCEQANESGLYF